MTGFELLISGVGIDQSINCATNTAPNISNSSSLLSIVYSALSHFEICS